MHNPFDFGVPEAHPQEPTLDLAQANQVLQASLSKLADEPNLEKFLGHLLTVCSDRFMATEAGIWRYENGLFRLFVSYEDGQIKHEESIGHPGASLATARKIQNQHVLARLRKREIISDYAEQFATEPVYEHFRDYFRRRGIQAALKIPLFLGDDLRGILVMRFRHRRVFKPEEAELAFALANQAVLALELTRLAEVAQTAAIMEERNRLARDIHDTLAQTFTSILMRLQAAALTLDEGGGAGARANIDRACDLAREGLANARHSVQALRPPALMGRSLSMALADALQQMTEGTPLTSEFRLEGQPVALADDIELELFRIAQEAITNSCKHAQARTLAVQLTYQSDRLRLMVGDDGVGFILTKSTALRGFGLISMQQRAERIGGNLTICSDHNQGTQICVVLSISRSQTHGDAV
ncbi:GAF domain-containing sensor histidine kinase [Leptolyngbya sp. CCNP1308]|uniref:GAF domain-containing sensor histidine kinase n=1 Tax=Leptolyngbya sp. CCNP1308 TaxID=3110255 RepID=UPI002B215E1F|nr:GAF domain-containing sensor histidine kinase [Leptolyngbya sp. CCNP1308]MEA5449681.1 GAF domain-containing sensor histidine kinase [Leptolyngbya sp. CCNP1308]